MSYYKKGCEPQNQRYIDDGFEAIEDQSFTDTETDRTYYVDYFDEIVDLVNEQDKTIKELEEENKQLKKRIKVLEREVQELSCGEADWLIEEML